MKSVAAALLLKAQFRRYVNIGVTNIISGDVAVPDLLV
jgi:hypothetical protein